MPSHTHGSKNDQEILDLVQTTAVPVPERSSSRPFPERATRRKAVQSAAESHDASPRLRRHENANRQATEAESWSRAIFEDAPIGILQVSADGRLLNLNRAMAQMLGYTSPEQLVAENSKGKAEKFFEPRQWSKAVSASGAGEVRRFDLQVGNRDGVAKWIRFHVREICENGRVVRYQGTGEDITEHKQIEVRTERLAYYDLLTGLPNRTLFHEQFEKVLAAAKYKKSQASLLLLQLDRFKVINDFLGKRFGDRLLQEIADRIILSAGANSLVARVGGAEFAIVLPEIEDLGDAACAAENIIARLSAKYSFFGHSLNVFCNVGISIFPRNGEDCDSLIKSADLAMSCSREEGLNRYCIFTEAMNEKVLETLRVEHGLQAALTRDELFLVYQPQVDVRTGQVIGLEALLRWNHPRSGIILPAKFIEVAECSGLIVPIGEWVLRTACAQGKKWQDAGLPPVPIAVNVSAIQFRQQGFCDLIRDVLRETGLDPRYLELELTESLLLNNADVMFSILQELKDMGVMLAIDDFGTGYSSLGYLRQFKVNRLKIARTFIRDVSVDSDDAAITTAIIKMAKALNLAVLAEGVETEAQLSFLHAQQCYTIQGFFFSKPVAVEQIDQALRSGFSHLAPSMLQ
jgi:diguanylate cyclase (GGDEF)-like protein/PAS domain S-box-containing protein